jgi:hypothetical protein
MATQVVAIIYALIFVGAEIIWLLTIRNRYVILISCATILVGVQGFSLIIVRDRFHMGDGYLLEYLGKLLAIDVFFILSLWVLFYSAFQYKSSSRLESDEIREQNLIENKPGPFSFLAGCLLYTSSVIETIITTRWFWRVLYLLFILLFVNSVCRRCSTWPDG